MEQENTQSIVQKCTIVFNSIESFRKPIKTHLTLYDLFPGKVYKSHLYRLALDPVHPAVADGADHDEEEGHPGHGVRGGPAGE